MQKQLNKFDIGRTVRTRKLQDRKTLAAESRTWYLSSPVLREYYSGLIHAQVRQAVPLRQKRKLYSIAPFVSAAMIFMLLIQSVVYLSAAKSAQGEILGAATSAYSDLSSAGGSLANQNFSNAQTQFDSALSSITDAKNKLDEFKALQLVAPQASGADHVLSGASLLASAGIKLTSALALFDELKVSDKGLSADNLTTKITQSKDTLAAALFLLQRAQNEFDSASGLPASYSDTLNKAKTQVGALTGMLQNLTNLEDIYLGLFGNGPRVYLMVFENYDETRATGGFIGTYGVLKVDSGKIQSLKIDSIYDLDGHIYEQVAAPGPFQPEIKKWGIRDANWFVDFPTTAKKLLQFYEYGGETADGVLAVTPSLFEDILNLTGPVPMPAYGVTVNSSNFQEVVQYKTSIDYDKKLNQPKKFLADLAPIMLNKLTSLDKQKWLELMQIMQTNLTQKQVLLYSKDSATEQKITDMKFSGNTLSSDQDYLQIVNDNLGGTKTDLKIDQIANLKTRILSDGTIIDTLSITRENRASAANKDFMRILIPEGSTVLSSQGFDPGTFNPSVAQGFTTDPDLAAWDQGQKLGDRTFIRHEAGKNEITGWLNTDPNESKTVILVYTIPYKASVSLFKNNVVYSLLLQKQPGTKAYSFSANIDAGDLKPYWLSAGANYSSGTINFDYNTGSDQYWATVLTK